MRPNNIFDDQSTRRTFLRTTGQVAAVTSLAALTIPHVHAAESNTIQLAIVGVGGRGRGAVGDALKSANAPIKLVAMADVFEKQIEVGKQAFKKFGKQFDCPEERQFVGFDAYKHAMDCLNPGDVVILTTPLAFRTLHFAYAINKGLNVFMEKPLTADGPKSREMLKLGKESIAKNLKVGVGLMCRHCEVRGELYKRIRNGEMGELILLRANRIAGDTASAYSKPRNVKESPSELLWQISRFHSFLWASGGAFSDFMIHNIDECCWMKDAWPVSALGLGGRTNRGEHIDQNFDNYTIDYTFADGTKLICEGRYLPGCTNDFASYAHGTKGMAVISTSGHSPAKSRIYSSQNQDASKLLWKGPDKERRPYELEWEHLIDAIRNDKPYNEVERGVQASVVTSMGRMSAHTGQKITFDEMLNCEHEFALDVSKFTNDSPAPVLADNDGKYPIPLPGIKSTREY